MMRATIKKSVWILVALLFAASTATAQADGKIAFVHRLWEESRIVVMDADGGNRQEIQSLDHVVRSGYGVGLSWSPDGQWIAGRRTLGFCCTELLLFDAERGGSTILVEGDAIYHQPSWSPDGTRIAYAALNNEVDGIYVMNADGSNPIRLTEGKEDHAPSWSPDGSRITFQSNRDGNVSQIYAMDADGGNITRLTDRAANDAEPKWSPDGSRIVFSSIERGDSPIESEIYIMDADGGNLVRLTDRPSVDAFPTWSPDGTQVLFTRSTGSTGGEGGDLWDLMDLYVMNADGSDVVNLTEGIEGGALGGVWLSTGEVASLVQSVSWGEVKRLSRRD